MLNKTDLKYLLLENLKKYTDNIIFIGGTNPYHFSINGSQYYILLRNISDSGNGRTNNDEARLQISYSNSLNEPLLSDIPILILGYYKEYNVFSSWDAVELRPRLNLRRSISVYSRFTILNKAMRDGLSIYVNDNGNKNICFSEEYIGLYVENYDRLHNLTETELLSLKYNSSGVSNTNIDSVRERVIITQTRFKRHKNFIDNVKMVYNHQCAFCGISLGLVEAAHIIPHSHELGSDDIFNGINLCSLHHKAYDSSLIYFDENYSIIINEKMLEYLEKVNKLNNLDKFISLSEGSLILPDDSIHFPKIENIIIANEIRGITI